jgi:hypothetical protein
MFIRVRYADNRYDYVDEHMLQRLIESHEITRFWRSSGWVTVGVGSLQEFQRVRYRKPKVEIKKIIHVAYSDNSYDYVPDTVLDKLIESKKIVKFERVTGWATIGVDPVRKASSEDSNRYPIELEKRAS